MPGTRTAFVREVRDGAFVHNIKAPSVHPSRLQTLDNIAAMFAGAGFRRELLRRLFEPVGEVRLEPVAAFLADSARKRLENKTVPYRPVKGFTLKTKTVEEMAAEKEKYRAT